MLDAWCASFAAVPRSPLSWRCASGTLRSARVGRRHRKRGWHAARTARAVRCTRRSPTAPVRRASSARRRQIPAAQPPRIALNRPSRARRSSCRTQRHSRSPQAWPFPWRCRRSRNGAPSSRCRPRPFQGISSFPSCWCSEHGRGVSARTSDPGGRAFPGRLQPVESHASRTSECHRRADQRRDDARLLSVSNLVRDPRSRVRHGVDHALLRRGSASPPGRTAAPSPPRSPPTSRTRRPRRGRRSPPRAGGTRRRGCVRR